MRKCCLKLFSTLLAVCFLVPALRPSAASDEETREVFVSTGAQSHCLMDGDSGKILLSGDMDRPLPIASTTKIMTCIVALENADVEQTVTVPQKAVGIEGSSMYLFKDQKLSLLELLYGLMLESANDAAVAIALHVSGSVEAFAELMNQKAAALGMKNSHFTNPNGLHEKEHYSSAYDMSVLMKYGLENELFSQIVSTQSHKIRISDGKDLYLANHNRLLRTYSGYTGGKTGFTKAAGRCLVSGARRNGKTLICVTLNDGSDWADHKKLLDFGFSLYSFSVLAKPNQLSRELAVVGAEAETVLVTNIDEVSVSVAADQEITVVYELPRFLYAPVYGLYRDESGEFSYLDTSVPVGQAVFMQNEEELARCDLYPAESIERPEKPSFWKNLMSKVKSFFSWNK